MNTAQNYGYGPDVEFFGAQVGLMRRFEGHFKNAMAMSRFLADGGLKSVGRKGQLAFKTVDIEAVLAEKRREKVAAIRSLGATEQRRITLELAEGLASASFRATPDHRDTAKAEAAVTEMVASAGRQTYAKGKGWNMTAGRDRNYSA